MELINFDRIVSVNSEIPGHNARNICDGGEISPNKNWMCEKGTEKASVILQLERAVVITSVHIGNAHSAFVEVLVGKAADSCDQFESLIPMSVFMSPHESKTGTNPNRTRFFNADAFNEDAGKKTWDRIKVVCSQPFNKLVPYGLCFVKVHGETEKEKKKDADKDEIQVGSFFKKMRKSSGDEKPLSVSEQMRKAEKETTMGKHSPLSLKLERKRKPSPTPGSSRDSPPPARKKKKKKKRKPFGKLMEDVVFVISGFQNPLRSHIRSKALEMGAKYSADWAPHCTHLVCAYVNTPKFQQVKGKGKIVKRDWVEVSYKDRRRYPWRRFALDKEDLKKKESEEEVEAGDDSEPEEPQELEEPVRPRSKDTAQTQSDDYDAPTDEEPEKLVDTTDYPMPFLPDFLSGKSFYVDPCLRDRTALERYVVAYNGSLTELRKDLEFCITTRFEGAVAKQIKETAPNALMVKPSWIWEINTRQEFVAPK